MDEILVALNARLRAALRDARLARVEARCWRRMVELLISEVSMQELRALQAEERVADLTQELAEIYDAHDCVGAALRAEAAAPQCEPWDTDTGRCGEPCPWQGDGYCSERGVP